MHVSKLTCIEGIAILLVIMANKIILNLPGIIITSTGSSAWINVLYIIAITFAFIFICIKLMKSFQGLDIIDISEYVGGSFLKAFVGILQILFISIIINIVVRNFSGTLKTIYFKQSPAIYIVLLLIISASIANIFGLKTISKVCLYVVPLAFLGLIVLLFVPAKNFEIQRLLPIFGFGINETFIKGISNLFAISGIGYVFLLPSLLQKHSDLKKVTFISLAISGLFLFLSIVCMLLVFSFFVDSNENMTLYLLTMVVYHGNLIHGINALFLIIWIISIICYISIALFFILFIVKKIGRLTDTKSMNYSFCSIFIALSLIMQNNSNFYFFIGDALKSSVLIFIFIFNPVLLIIANIKKKLKSLNTQSTSKKTIE